MCARAYFHSRMLIYVHSSGALIGRRCEIFKVLMQLLMRFLLFFLCGWLCV